MKTSQQLKKAFVFLTLLLISTVTPIAGSNPEPSSTATPSLASHQQEIQDAAYTVYTGELEDTGTDFHYATLDTRKPCHGTLL